MTVLELKDVEFCRDLDHGEYFLTEIGDSAFWNCQSLRKAELPEGLKAIGKEAFRGCTSLEVVNFPVSITSICEYAFAGCKVLKVIELNEGLQYLGLRVFMDCECLTRIKIPSSVTEFGKLVFFGCVGLTEVELSEGIELIGDSSFAYCESLTRISVPSTVTAIGNNAFEGCYALKEVTLQGGLQQIGDGSFSCCMSLSQISLPSTIIEIGNSAFQNCPSLEKVNLCDGLQLIKESAFMACKSLPRIIIPSTVLSIGSNAFGYCSSLKEVELSGKRPSIAKDAFSFCDSVFCFVMIRREQKSDSAEVGLLKKRQKELEMALASKEKHIAILTGALKRKKIEVVDLNESHDISLTNEPAAQRPRQHSQAQTQNVQLKQEFSAETEDELSVLGVSAQANTMTTRSMTNTQQTLKRENILNCDICCPDPECRKIISFTDGRGCNVITCRNHSPYLHFCIHCKGVAATGYAKCSCPKRNTMETRAEAQRKRNLDARLNPIVLD